MNCAVVTTRPGPCGQRIVVRCKLTAGHRGSHIPERTGQ